MQSLENFMYYNICNGKDVKTHTKNIHVEEVIYPCKNFRDTDKEHRCKLAHYVKEHDLNISSSIFFSWLRTIRNMKNPFHRSL